MTGLTDMIRSYARTVGRFRVTELARELGIAYERAGGTVGDLVKQGELRRVSRGVYEYVDHLASARPGPKMQAVWKAMRINSTWTLKEVARQAGVTTDYAAKLTHRWKREALVEPVGWRRTESVYGRARVYRLKDRTCLRPPHTKVSESTEDPLKRLAWQALGRILLGKIAMPGEREQCIRELRQLMEALNEHPEEQKV